MHRHRMLQMVVGGGLAQVDELMQLMMLGEGLCVGFYQSLVVLNQAAHELVKGLDFYQAGVGLLVVEGLLLGRRDNLAS
jgi:hypothetical protein